MNQNENTIESCPEEAEIPFAQIPNDLIRNKIMSPECRDIIIQLISNKPGWRINVKQLVNFYKGHWGRDKVYRLIKEAIDLGYMRKEETRSKNTFGVVKYFVSRTPKFKKSFTLPENQYTENEYTENTHYKNSDNLKERLSCFAKKSDNDSVHNSKPKVSSNPDPTAYRSLHAHAPIASFDPSTFDPHTYRMPNGQSLSLQCARAFKKYTGEAKARLYANIELFEAKYKKDSSKIANPEAYLQQCIKENYAGKEMQRYQNWLYAQCVVEDSKLNHVIVLKTVIKHKARGKDSLSLYLPPETFADAMNNFLGISRR